MPRIDTPQRDSGLKFGPRGAALFAALTDEYDFAPHERDLLIELARTADDLDALAERVATQGHTIAGRVNPALVEARQLRLAYARLSAAMRLPTDESESGAAPQRRVGVRGIYGIGA